MIEDALAGLAASAAALPVLFLLVLGDAFLVVIPGETAVTAYAALSVSHGQPPLMAIITVAAVAALAGDVACYVIGRRVGLDRWGWMRRPRVVAAFGWARARLDRSTAAVLFSARFIPFGRLAVNLTAGAGRVPAPRYVLFAAGAALVWALYQAFIGALVARLVPGSSVLAVVISIAVALALGLILDAVLARRWRPGTRPTPAGTPATPGGNGKCQGGGMENLIDLGGVHVYRAEPEGPPRAAIVLVHEIWGLVPHIRDVADRLAVEGYLVLAPDLLSDIGITPEVGLDILAMMSDPDEERRLAAQPRLRDALAPIRTPQFAAGAVARLRLAVDALEVEPGIDGRIAVMGFCFGGTYSFALAAADSRVRAAVPFYGQAPAPDDIAQIACPILALYGQDDPPLIDALPEVRANMAAARVDFTAVVYPDSTHAFFNDTNPQRYNATDAADAWKRALAFLSDTLG
jgi:carboxymethylenebutenolidase